MKRKRQNPLFLPKALSARNTTPASGGIASRGGRAGASAKAKKSGGGSVASRAAAIDEAKLAAHFKKGGTLAEFLRDNPAPSYRNLSAEKLEQIRAIIGVGLYDNDWLVRDRTRREVEKVDAALVRARRRAGKSTRNPGDVTDRAHRYRAQKNVPAGPRVCVLCGSRQSIDVMHLDGDEWNDESKNLAFGCRPCNATLGAAFKRANIGRPTRQFNPGGKSIPTLEQYAWAVSQGGPQGHRLGTGSAHDEAGAVIHATPKAARIRYARRIAEGQRTRRRAADDAKWNPPIKNPIGKYEYRVGVRRVQVGGAGAKSDAQALDKAQGYADRFNTVVTVLDVPSRMSHSGSFERTVGTATGAGQVGRVYEDWRRKNSAKASGIPRHPGFGGRPFRGAPDYAGQLDAINAEMGRHSIISKKWRALNVRKEKLLDKVSAEYRRGNPAAGAAQGYEDFHGKAPEEFVTVAERRHYHTHLSGAGTLERLVVAAIDGKANVTLRGFGGALLAFNEARNQLFIVGGDQSVDLESFGIRKAKAHELETLGRVLSLDYKTDKRHLGSEGGNAVYRHRLRTTNEDGRHVTVRIARYPDLIYRVRDKALEFSGGSYEILPEGIDK